VKVAVSQKQLNKCVSKMHIDLRGVQLKLWPTPHHPLFKRNISVAYCMHASIYSQGFLT